MKQQMYINVIILHLFVPKKMLFFSQVYEDGSFVLPSVG